MDETAPTRRIYDVTKKYPDGTTKLIKFNVSFEVTLGAKPKGKNHSLPSGIISQLNQNRSLRHTKTTIQDIIKSNRFEHWTTLTFDPKKVKSRYDLPVLKMKAHRFFESQRKKYGQFSYLVVPEQCKDGAIHFHCLFEGYRGPIRPTRVNKYGKQLHDFPAWRYGFSDTQYINQSPEDYQKLSGYISKYVTKDMITFSGKKRYWVSQGLRRPEKFVNDYHQNRHSKIYCAT